MARARNPRKTRLRLTTALSLALACGLLLSWHFSGGLRPTAYAASYLRAPAQAAAATFSADLFTADEGAGVATITVVRADAAAPVTVNYATGDGSATAGLDYAAASGSLTFAAGETSKTFTVTILEDGLDESDEDVRLTLTSADGASTVLSRASLVITDNDPPPALSVSDVSAPEGDFDNTNFVFHISLSAPSGKAVTANVSAADGTAVGGGNDYFAFGGPSTLTFAPGETDKTVTLIVKGDLDIEPDETFFVNVTNIVNATAADPQGQGTILNDDAVPTVSLSINDVSVLEGNYGTTDAVFTVSLSGATAKIVKVDYLPTGGQGTEIVPFGGTLTFAPGETAKTVTAQVIGDTRFEPDEQIGVRLSNPRNALMADDLGVLTILNDEAPPTLSVNDVSVREGDGGDKQVFFTVTLSSPIETQTSFQYMTVPGTATELAPPTATGLEDYAGVFGAALIAPGVTRVGISVPIKGDTRPEPNETFFLRISNPINGVTIADGEGKCVIIDDDGGVAPAFQFSAGEYKATEDSGQVAVTVMRAGDLSAAASVNYSTRSSAGPRSASERSDYTAAAGTLRFAPGEESKTFNVLLTDDAFPERDPNLGDEFIDLVLSDPTGGVALGEPQAAIITIIDNDAVTGSQNPIDDAQFYVRQHYHDFLNREPDASGLQFWTNGIKSCGADAHCREVKRVDTSAAFFLSIEFQETGYLVYRAYKAAYGDATSPNVPGTVPVVRLREFLSDTQEIGRGVVVGQGSWQQQLENNKQAFALEFVGRQRFTDAFPPSMSAAQFVSKLDQNAGGVLTQGERDQLVSQLSSAADVAAGRAAVLRQVADNAALKTNEFDRAFVLMQYFGYLRRDPDDAPDGDFRGWKFWLDKLNQFNGDFVQAEMVKAFITSDEYRHRFGQ